MTRDVEAVRYDIGRDGSDQPPAPRQAECLFAERIADDGAVTAAVNGAAEFEQRFQERLVSVDRLRVHGDQIVLDDTCLELTPAALADICRRFRAPYTYLSRLRGDVRSAVLQAHIEDGAVGNVVSIFSTGPEFVAFGNPWLLRLPTNEVIAAVLDGIEPTTRVTVQNLSFCGTSWQLDLVSPDTQREVRPGDVVRAGLRVTHSVVGAHAVWVEAFVVRLLCMNGLTHRTCASRRGPRTRRLRRDHPDARKLQREQVSRLATDAWSALSAKFDAIAEIEREHADVERLLEQWIRRARLSPRLILPRVREAWQRDGAGSTVFDAVNAITWVSTHALDLAADQRRVLGRLAGVLALRGVHLCPRCFAVLTDSQS